MAAYRKGKDTLQQIADTVGVESDFIKDGLKEMGRTNWPVGNTNAETQVVMTRRALALARLVNEGMTVEKAAVGAVS
jgi:hypothetical protein